MGWEAGDRKWTGVIPRDRNITGHSQREERKELLFPVGMQALLRARTLFCNLLHP